MAQIYAVYKQQIKGKEHGFAPSEQEFIEYRSPGLIHASDLTIKYGVLDAQILADPLSKILEVVECVSVPRDEIALAVLDVSEGPESIDLQLENVIVRVEWFRTA